MNSYSRDFGVVLFYEPIRLDMETASASYDRPMAKAVPAGVARLTRRALCVADLVSSFPEPRGAPQPACFDQRVREGRAVVEGP